MGFLRGAKTDLLLLSSDTLSPLLLPSFVVGISVTTTLTSGCCASGGCVLLSGRSVSIS